MTIDLHEITIKDATDGYADSQEEGVVAYGGNLNIRPKYQREFIYSEEKQKAVIDTVKKGFPLNVMYWVKIGDGKYEVMDGQQRLLSICRYISGDLFHDGNFFPNLTSDQKKRINDYKLMVYICEGTDREKLEWFKTINIAGEELTDQELRNAVYTGEWLTDAKKRFSKTSCAAYQIGNKLLTGTAIRQDYLETVLSWISNRNKTSIEKYMAEHQRDPDATELWMYFTNIINWINGTFPNYRKEMKGIDWGSLYDAYHDKPLNASVLEKRIKDMMMDDDVTNKKGIYQYILSDNEKFLNIRAFTESMKRAAYERQNGICTHCGKHFEIEAMEGDHITPWHEGGKTSADNCQMLCKHCNRVKSGN